MQFSLSFVYFISIPTYLVEGVVQGWSHGLVGINSTWHLIYLAYMYVLLKCCYRSKYPKI